jgi:hypothetical protein
VGCHLERVLASEGRQIHTKHKNPKNVKNKTFFGTMNLFKNLFLNDKKGFEK